MIVKIAFYLKTNCVGEDFTTLLFNSAKKLALCKLVAKVILSSNSIKIFLWVCLWTQFIQQTYLSINSTISKRKAHYVNEDQEVEQHGQNNESELTNLNNANCFSGPTPLKSEHTNTTIKRTESQYKRSVNLK